jgi:hypothetical protein
MGPVDRTAAAIGGSGDNDVQDREGITVNRPHGSQFPRDGIVALNAPHVRLTSGPLRDRQTSNGQYLLALQPDRLLHNFRINAGLPSLALPLGGWENPSCGLRGHFTGHYLSACAKMSAATGDAAFQERLELLLAGLNECQSRSGNGYLSAFPEFEFDRLEKEFGGVWAPYYTIHKLLAGLIDSFKLGKQGVAKAMAIELGDWIAARLGRLCESTLEPMLRTDQLNPANEYGGIGESLYDLYDLTGAAAHLKTAQIFDRAWFLDPLSQGRDELAGLHANTHIPQAIAAVRRYQITGEHRFRRAAENFWSFVAGDRSYINGGNSGPRPDHCERSEGGEHWPLANQLHKTLTPKINESCVANNMFRLTNLLATVDDDPRYSEFRERLLFNSILPMQHPAIRGAYIYSHPLGGGCRKIFGDADQTFWCCYGTAVEAFASLTSGAFSFQGDTLLVNQFLNCELNWQQKGLRLMQETGFPCQPSTRFRLEMSRPGEFAISLRIPGWAAKPRCLLNGSEVAIQGPHRLVLYRQWKDGDTIELSLPMRLRSETLPGDPTHLGFVCGPAVLAGRTPHALELAGTNDQATSAIQEVDGLRFQATLVSGAVIPMVPLWEITDEAFGVYFKTQGDSPCGGG